MGRGFEAVHRGFTVAAVKKMPSLRAIPLGSARAGTRVHVGNFLHPRCLVDTRRAVCVLWLLGRVIGCGAGQPSGAAAAKPAMGTSGAGAAVIAASVASQP